jgi:hypothetical protein
MLDEPGKQPANGMDGDAAGRIRDMNLLPATRIGWEHRQQYIDRLIEMSADHLTAGEFQARLEWLQNAKTIEEAKIVFRDLPSLRVTKTELAPHLRPKPQRSGEPATSTSAWRAFWFLFALDLGLWSFFVFTGNLLVAVGVSLLLTFLWGGALLVLRSRDERR